MVACRGKARAGRSQSRLFQRGVGPAGLARAAIFGLVVPLSTAQAAPVAHVLRVDPDTSVESGSPILTTVIDLVEPKRMADVIGACGTLQGDERYDCMSDALEKPESLFASVAFPGKDALLTVRVGGVDVRATLVDHQKFGAAQSEPRTGTAWLLVIDADSRMGVGFDEAKAVVTRFVEAMGPSDLVDLVILGENQVLADSKWLDAVGRPAALALLDKQTDTTRGAARTRPLLGLLQTAAKDAMGGLGSIPRSRIPLHQAMVVISSGYGGGDPATTGPGAAQLARVLSEGRLDGPNSARPKMPLPLVSVFVPPKTMPEHRQLAEGFMQALANPEIGGFFTVLRDGQAAHAGRIVDAVRSRFSSLTLARFKAACLAPTTSQTLSLTFPEHDPPIVGDGSFVDVPIGFDPRDWPLDLDVELTRRKARDAGGVHPGGTFRVFGSFCWGSDASRPEVYFLPPGERLAEDLDAATSEAGDVQKRLTALDMRASAVAASDTFALFVAPDSEQILHGDGERATVRFVVVDALTKRSSGLTEATVIQLRGRKPPVPLVVVGLAGAMGLLLLGIVVLLVRGARRPSGQSPGRFRVTESPYATPGAVTKSPRVDTKTLRATLESGYGRFTVLGDGELRVGRDGTRVTAILPNPSVSNHHATFRFEGSRLVVRDESSGAGVRVGEQLIAKGAWHPVEDGDSVSLGSETLRVKVTRP